MYVVHNHINASLTNVMLLYRRQAITQKCKHNVICLSLSQHGVYRCVIRFTGMFTFLRHCLTNIANTDASSGLPVCLHFASWLYGSVICYACSQLIYVFYIAWSFSVVVTLQDDPNIRATLFLNQGMVKKLITYSNCIAPVSWAIYVILIFKQNHRKKAPITQQVTKILMDYARKI